jgi:hypothetical protein
MGYKPVTELQIGKIVYSTEDDFRTFISLRTVGVDRVALLAKGFLENDSYGIDGIAPLQGKRPGRASLYRYKNGKKDAELVAELECVRSPYLMWGRLP